MQALKTVVLNCAGIGSGLGLGRTKVLMEINGISLLSMHLANFSEVEDLRIVVGFQANDVIRETLAIRKDVTFVYNHDYFNTRTGYSLGLAARFADDLVLTWDGDAVVHPEDARVCLNQPEPFLAYSEVMTQDAVGCLVKNGYVTSFVQGGDGPKDRHAYEWTGIACAPGKSIQLLNKHVYELVTPLLPLPAIKIRAMDIDTYADYKKASVFVEAWKNDG